MDFELNEEQRNIRNLAREFAEGEVAPKVIEYEAQSYLPAEFMRQMGKLGLLGLPFPEEYGGSGGDALSYAMAVEEVSRVWASLGLSYAAHVSLGTMPLYLFGTEEQKAKWLAPCAQGEMLAAFGLTEPEAGSDAGATRTKASLDGDQWVVDGSKAFTTNCITAGYMVITAVTGAFDAPRKEISNLIVPAGTPGLTIGKRYDKMGFRATDVAPLTFENCRVPKDNLLGTEGQGFKQFMKTLDGGRISIAALAVGIAQACLDESVKYAKSRWQFGQPLSKFQAIQFKIADMSTRVELARLVTHKAACLKDAGKPFTREAAMAKLFAAETAMAAATEAVQIFGGNGYMEDFPVQRLFRDAKLLEIAEGTSEVQRIVIAREAGC